MKPSPYSWQTTSNQPSFKTETTRNLGWWILLAVLISVAIHVFLYVALGEMEWMRGNGKSEEIFWQNKRRDLTIDKEKLDALLPKPEAEEPEIAKPEKLSDLPMIDKSLDEFDIMEALKDEPIRMAPIETPQIFSAERPKAPKQALEATAETIDVSASEVLNRDLREMREKLLESSVVSNDQPVMQLNQDDLSSTVDTDDFFRKAAAKAFGDNAGAFMEGYNTLDGIIGRTGGLPSGKEKIMMPTDILFDYNQFELREQARLSMMKLAFIVQTNPDAQFVIEGHTDTLGTDEYNYNLSLQRAAAVREWLVGRLQIGVDNIKILGFGETRPLPNINPEGTAEEQTLNRRVEIVIRKS